MRAHDQTRSSERVPSLTFVVPVYDPPAEVFAQLLDSIAAQTNDDWECLLVNDGSRRADVVSTIDARAAADPRFRAVHRPTNGGIAAATNTGIDAARGDIVAFADHDDFVDEQAVEAIIAHFAEHPNDDLIYTDERLIDEDGHTLADYNKPDYSPIRHLGHHYLAHLIACRRAAIGDIRVRSEFEPSQDIDFVLRVIERATDRGRSIGHIPRQLYGWRAITGSSALDASEKPEMCAAVERSIQAALDRRGIAHRVSSVILAGKPTTSVRFELDPVPATDIAVIDIDDSTAAVAVAEQIASSDRRFVWLRPPGDHPADVAGRLAAEVSVRGRAIAGPQLVDTDGNLLSAGRVVEPTLADSFTGSAMGAGPWGAFLVTREASTVAPWGAMIDREAAVAAGGFPTDVGLDAGLAELSIRLARSGQATVWSPATTLTIDDRLVGAVDPVTLDDAWTIARTRLGDVSEHHQANGVAHLGFSSTDVITEARRRVLRGEVALLTSDVFDTLVTRSVARPSDLFVSLAGRLHALGVLDANVTPLEFAHARRSAERRARAAIAAVVTDRLPECTLDEIWAEMPDGWVTERPMAIGAELAHEAAHLTVIEPAASLLELARDLGVPVTLVSDIYMSAVQLRDVLVGAGLDMAASVQIVTSADQRLGKSDGLLGQVIDAAGVPAAQVLHVGDNEIADVHAATELGAHAVEVEIPERSTFVPRRPTELAAYSAAHATDGGITAAVRATLIGSPSGMHPSYQFGAVAAGPPLAGFARWAATTTQRLGASTVHCLLREGATIADLIGIVAPDGPTTRLVHASRWVDLRAAVITGSADEIRGGLARRYVLTIDDIHRAFGCDLDALRSLLGDEPISPAALADAAELLAGNDALRSQIVESAAALRTRVVRQLRAELLIDDGPIMLCDVGWGGTIQEGITRILRSDGIDNEVIGLYLALSAPGEDRLARGSRMLSYLPNVTDHAVHAADSRVISHHADSIERVLTPLTGTLLDIDDDGNPILDPRPEYQPPTLGAAQRGLLEVTAELTARGFEDRVWVDDLEFRAALGSSLAHVIESPTSEVAIPLTSWRHDDVAGTASESLAGSHERSLISRANAHDVDALRAGTAGWIEGMAATSNPALVAQLAARRAGVPIDRLLPPSPAGMTRLAAFPVGSDMATLQNAAFLRMHPDGWSVARLSGPMESLRSIRFDAGSEAALVQLERFQVEITHSNGTTLMDLADVSTHATELEWVTAHPVGQRRFVYRSGGHVIVPIGAALGAGSCTIDVDVVFRRWIIDEDDAILRPPVKHRIERGLTRAQRVAKRQIERRSGG